MMRVKLKSLDPLTPGLRIRLDELPVVIGRSPDAGIRLHDHWLSRMHCEISEFGGTLVVRDLKSRNGTLVNGKSIGQTDLLPGDRLTVGLSSFEVQYKHRTAKSSADGPAAELVQIPPGRRRPLPR